MIIKMIDVKKNGKLRYALEIRNCSFDRIFIYYNGKEFRAVSKLKTVIAGLKRTDVKFSESYDEVAKIPNLRETLTSDFYKNFIKVLIQSDLLDDEKVTIISKCYMTNSEVCKYVNAICYNCFTNNKNSKGGMISSVG